MTSNRRMRRVVCVAKLIDVKFAIPERAL
jgi:hypothetical protein